MYDTEMKRVIFKEAIRLEDNENILKLAKEKKFHELSQVKIRNNELIEYFKNNTYTFTIMELKYKRLLSLLMIAREINQATKKKSICFEREHVFARKIVEDAGDMGKNIVVWMLKGKSMLDLSDSHFFSDEYAQEYYYDSNDDDEE